MPHYPAYTSVTGNGGQKGQRCPRKLRKLDPCVPAPIIAADKAPDRVPGVFVLNVQASGRSNGDLYLNSETDYRDQRNLSIRILPKAQDELRKSMATILKRHSRENPSR